MTLIRINGLKEDEYIYPNQEILIPNKKTYKVITELNIRYVLNDGKSEVVRQDGSSVVMNKLIPSAFIWSSNSCFNSSRNLL